MAVGPWSSVAVSQTHLLHRAAKLPGAQLPARTALAERVAIAPTLLAELLATALAREHRLSLPTALTHQHQPEALGEHRGEILGAAAGGKRGHDPIVAQPAHTRSMAAHCWGVTVRSQRALIRA